MIHPTANTVYECVLLEHEPLAVEMMEEYIGKRSELKLVAKAAEIWEFKEMMQKCIGSIAFIDILVPDGGSGGFSFSSIPSEITVVVASALPFSDYAHYFAHREVFELYKPISLNKFNECVDDVLYYLKNK